MWPAYRSASRLLMQAQGSFTEGEDWPERILGGGVVIDPQDIDERDGGPHLMEQSGDAGSHLVGRNVVTALADTAGDAGLVEQPWTPDESAP